MRGLVGSKAILVPSENVIILLHGLGQSSEAGLLPLLDQAKAVSQFCFLVQPGPQTGSGECKGRKIAPVKLAVSRVSRAIPVVLLPISRRARLLGCGHCCISV